MARKKQFSFLQDKEKASKITMKQSDFDKMLLGTVVKKKKDKKSKNKT